MVKWSHEARYSVKYISKRTEIFSRIRSQSSFLQYFTPYLLRPKQYGPCVGSLNRCAISLSVGSSVLRTARPAVSVLSEPSSHQYTYQTIHHPATRSNERPSILNDKVEILLFLSLETVVINCFICSTFTLRGVEPACISCWEKVIYV